MTDTSSGSGFEKGTQSESVAGAEKGNLAPCGICGEPRGDANPCPACGME